MHAFAEAAFRWKTTSWSSRLFFPPLLPGCLLFTTVPCEHVCSSGLHNGDKEQQGAEQIISLPSAPSHCHAVSMCSGRVTHTRSGSADGGRWIQSEVSIGGAAPGVKERRRCWTEEYESRLYESQEPESKLDLGFSAGSLPVLLLPHTVETHACGWIGNSIMDGCVEGWMDFLLF